MVETLHAADGLGLAAPQVAVSERLFVAEIEESEEHPGSGKLYVVLTPSTSSGPTRRWMAQKDVYPSPAGPAK